MGGETISGMTDDLVAFLRARLDEDERAARSAHSEQWTVEPFVPSELGALPGAAWVVTGVEGETGIASVNGSYRAEHIARNDPARVLRQVEAKRRIIGELWDVDEGFATEHTAPATAKAVLRLLATVYADHPDYRAEWKP